MPTPNQFSNVYDLEYFSGAQMNMYIGDVLIDEVTSLEVKVHQKKMPVYGYASQLFDKVAAGTILVEGSFTINYKESGYLYTVLERYRSLIKGGHSNKQSPFISQDALSQISKNRTGGAISNNQKGFLRRQNIEQINASVEEIISGKNINGDNIRPEELIDYYNSITGFNNNSRARNGSAPGALPPTEAIFETFEDKIWGSEDLNRDSEGRRGDSNRFDDFTIYVTMGDYNRNDRVNHTAKRIDNVHLLGQAQTIAINGEPIAEAYWFFAKNFV
jgi:hypothetical protein